MVKLRTGLPLRESVSFCTDNRTSATASHGLRSFSSYEFEPGFSLRRTVCLITGALIVCAERINDQPGRI